jgi:hypothetical protein
LVIEVFEIPELILERELIERVSNRSAGVAVGSPRQDDRLLQERTRIPLFARTDCWVFGAEARRPMPKRRNPPLFELGDFWIQAEPGRTAYRYWYELGTRRVRRARCASKDFEAAKLELAELVVRGAPKSATSYLATILETYFIDRTDKRPSKIRHAALAYCFSNSSRVSEKPRRRASLISTRSASASPNSPPGVRE